MFRHHQSPRHLDDPLRPLFGLSVAQAAGLLLAIGAALGAWKLMGQVPLTGYLLNEARIFAAGAVAAFVFFAIYALADDHTEPFARQLWGFARRGHHYAPSPLVTHVLENVDDQAAQAQAPAQGQLHPAPLPPFTHRVRPFRHHHRR